MRNQIFHLIIAIIVFCSCKAKKTPDAATIEQYKAEIVQAEKEFCDMAKKEGIPKAFITFSADEVVLLRKKKLIIGKEALKELYSDTTHNTNTSLTWAPDFVDVAASGDLGYTYGQYIFSSTDSTGNTTESKGVFHTVWKRQQDGKWKFVWD